MQGSWVVWIYLCKPEGAFQCSPFLGFCIEQWILCGSHFNKPVFLLPSELSSKFKLYINHWKSLVLMKYAAPNSVNAVRSYERKKMKCTKIPKYQNQYHFANLVACFICTIRHGPATQRQCTTLYAVPTSSQRSCGLLRILTLAIKTTMSNHFGHRVFKGFGFSRIILF